MRENELWSERPNEEVGWDGKTEAWENTGHHAVTVYSADVHGWRAYVKWDGCIDLEFFHNGTNPLDENVDDRDYLHICNLDDLIRRLEGLRRIATGRYGEEWPG